MRNIQNACDGPEDAFREGDGNKILCSIDERYSLI